MLLEYHALLQRVEQPPCEPLEEQTDAAASPPHGQEGGGEETRLLLEEPSSPGPSSPGRGKGGEAQLRVEREKNAKLQAELAELRADSQVRG